MSTDVRLRDRAARILTQDKPTPYREFFTAGLLFGIASVGIWAFFAFGEESLGGYPGIFHVFGVISLFLGSFVLGFLLTALPRFTATPPAKFGLLIVLALLTATELVCLIYVGPIFAYLSCALKFLIVEAFALSRFRLARFPPPPSFVWIGAGLVSVVLGALGKAATEAAWIQSFEPAQFAHLLFTRAFILSLFMGIGTRLFPVLSGVHRVSAMQIQSAPDKKHGSEKILHAFLAVFFIFGLAVEAWSQNDARLRLGLFMQFLVVAIEVFALWKMYRKAEATSRGRALKISAWSMVLGYLLAIAFPALRIHCMHLVYVAGFLGGTLAIGAHVLVNHEAMDQSLLKRFWPLGVLSTLILAATAFRIAAPFWETQYMLFTGIASVLVVLSLSLWGGHYVTPLWKTKS